ncbi:MAG TPA: tRNA pseudouridine(38-40) synthase TruA [Vicinamibacterales bacterium]|nr:tRNA pseudouridine(38-40) synthase TruA [Vicinamibacterales bacterium]
MRVLKLLLQYDGTEYVGWQRQATGTSIQGLLEDALRPIEGGDVTVHGAGRTDAGVHALGQVASVRLTASIEPDTLARALNAVLPLDVRVARAEVMPDDFHARFSATGKVYDYRIVNGPFASPLVRRYVWLVVPPLNVAVMRAAAAGLVGEHDFGAFQGPRSNVRTSVRTVRRIEWQGTGTSEDPLVLRMEGSGFLRHMVRTIAGTLVEIGVGRRSIEDLGVILASKDRERAGTTAPAAGLILREVLYSHKIAT